MKWIFCAVAILYLQGCQSLVENKKRIRQERIQRLKQVQYSRDSIGNISNVLEPAMNQVRYDTLKIYYDRLSSEHDSLLKLLDSVIYMKHDD